MCMMMMMMQKGRLCFLLSVEFPLILPTCRRLDVTTCRRLDVTPCSLLTLTTGNEPALLHGIFKMIFVCNVFVGRAHMTIIGLYFI